MNLTDRHSTSIWLPALLGVVILASAYFAPHDSTLMSVALGTLALAVAAMAAWKRYSVKRNQRP